MSTQRSFGVALERNGITIPNQRKVSAVGGGPARMKYGIFIFYVDGIIFATSFRFRIVLFFDATTGFSLKSEDVKREKSAMPSMAAVVLFK
jgi:hypothetical protein